MAVKVIPISGVIGWDVTGQGVREALAEAGGEEVRAEFATPGGLVFDGLEIFNLFASYEGKKTAHIIGLAASMGSYLPLAFDRVTGEENMVMMLHNAWGLSVGDHNAMRKAADVWEGMSNILATAYAKKTGKSMDEIKADMDGEKWLYGQEAVAYGMVDEIVGTVAGSADEGQKAKAIMDARVHLAAAQKLVAEYEGGDSIQRVAALVTTMQPKAEKKADVVVPAVKPAKTENKGGSKIMTLDQLKAESPEVYAQALNDGIKAERDAEKDRVTKINAFAGNGPAAKLACDEAVAQGTSYDDALPKLMAASLKPQSKQENAPDVATSTEPLAVGLDGDDMKAAAAFGLSAKEYTEGLAVAAKMGGITVEDIKSASLRKEA